MSFFTHNNPATELRKARNATHTHATEAQRHAGNYRKGQLTFQGMKISLENPEGSTRSGTDDNGKAWKTTMSADYGYFTNTMAADGDAVDCFIGPDLDSEFVVAVDQYKGTKFDEPKFLLGTTAQAQAEKLYLSHYQKGWKLGPVSTTTTAQLKTWLKNGDTKKPFNGQMVKAAEVSFSEKPRTFKVGDFSFFRSRPKVEGHELTAEEDGKELGHVHHHPAVSPETGKPWPKETWLKQIHVNEEDRGKGVGSSLLQRLLEQQAKKKHLTMLQVRPFGKNPQSEEDLHQWYGDRGFKDYKEGDEDYMVANAPEDREKGSPSTVR